MMFVDGTTESLFVTCEIEYFVFENKGWLNKQC